MSAAACGSTFACAPAGERAASASARADGFAFAPAGAASPPCLPERREAFDRQRHVAELVRDRIERLRDRARCREVRPIERAQAGHAEQRALEPPACVGGRRAARIKRGRRQHDDARRPRAAGGERGERIEPRIRALREQRGERVGRLGAIVRLVPHEIGEPHEQQRRIVRMPRIGGDERLQQLVVARERDVAEASRAQQRIERRSGERRADVEATGAHRASSGSAPAGAAW
ncbi:Uncharacterised protein [Burkholderia pseudomallei]|nr:Uncharacterised protein [Burkholderia pseudomallei]